MPRQIEGSQWDFSFGEVDVALKRASGHPARKGGLRQMANARILNSGSIQDRPGRRALFPIQNSCTRWEEFTISPGNVYKIGFGAARLQIVNANGQLIANFATQGGGGALPWTANNLNQARYAILGLAITVTFPGMRPQVVTFDGVSTWTIADYAELVIGNQKRTFFYRMAPQGIAIQPASRTGTVTIATSGGVAAFSPSQVGTRIRFVGRQILITVYTNPSQVTGVIQEPLPGSQSINFGSDPTFIFSVGDVVLGTNSGAKGVVFSVSSTAIGVQLLTLNSSSVTSTDYSGTYTSTYAFTTSDGVVGPGGALAPTTVSAINNPLPCTIWDEEVMNSYRGYPQSVFVDQFRLGFCNFPSVPNGIGWSAINSPNDLYVGSNASNAIFELAPGKVQIYDVVPGPESSEFVFCDRNVYYIPISPTNPLKPGSVAFQTISGDGAANVRPRIAQEAILYVNAGQNSVIAIIASGAYNRPFNTKNLTELHSHLFNNIQCIAAPNADGTFNERYAYVLNGDGTIAVGKYDATSLQSSKTPTIGWGPWSGVGTVSWISAWSADVIFTTSYFGTLICEILDDAQYLDCALLVNAAPAVLAPPGGKGPLWFIPNQSVVLIDQGTRIMGTYQIDANGFIIPQFNGGEDLTRLDLVAGQQWTVTVEPFSPDAQPGADVRQRMELRQISKVAIYTINSTGLVVASLFSGPAQTPTSPALGTVMKTMRFPAWTQDEDATKPPILRETVYGWTPPGSSFDPRVAIIKDTPGPLLICEIGMEISL